MKFEVWNHDVLIGETNLEDGDRRMDVRAGRFCPLEPYFALQHIFRAVTTAVEQRGPDQANALATAALSRASLAVTVRERGGAVVLSSAIHIADFADRSEAQEITVYPPAN